MRAVILLVLLAGTTQAGPARTQAPEPQYDFSLSARREDQAGGERGAG